MSVDDPQVVFLMRHVHHYREPFYRGLKDRLSNDGVKFELVHGQPSPAESTKNDSLMPDWSTFVPNKILSVADRELIYQPILRLVQDKDLVIMEQASRLLVNYPLFLRHAAGRGPELALVGHGANLASSPNPAGEMVKRAYTSQVDWFFGYTDTTRDLLHKAGFAQDRITIFQNTLDMTGLRQDLDDIGAAELNNYKRAQGIDGSRVVLVLGSLYDDKRPDLIVPTAELMRESNGDVTFLVIGSGPSSDLLREAATSRPWIKLKEAAFGREKALALKASDAMLVPGVAGLVILDCFAAGLPLVLAKNPHHPPEIAYLESGSNSIVLPDPTPGGFANALGGLLADQDRSNRIGEAALETGSGLTIEGMVNRFADGVLSALGRPKR